MDDLKHKLITDPRYQEELTRIMESPTVLLAPTNYCNFACAYCSTSSLKNKHVNADMEFVRDVVDQTVEQGWPLAFGQTYEPFLHPKIHEIVQYVHEKGRRYFSGTNATALTQKTWDLPMNLLISYSANEKDFVYRGTSLDFGKYHSGLMDFTRHRIANTIPGSLKFQIADYTIMEKPTLEYDKAIHQTDQIYAKAVELAEALDVAAEHDPEEWKALINERKPITLFRQGETEIQALSTKIMQNTYETFLEMDKDTRIKGYCDSCYTMMSIQADRSVAYCCCDPTAKAIAGSIRPGQSIKEFWEGPDMQRVRDGFQNFAPEAEFCHHCLAPVSEHIKPLLTMKKPQLVGEILSEHGVDRDLPWFQFPK